MALVSNPQGDGTRENLRPSSILRTNCNVMRRCMFGRNNWRKRDDGQKDRCGGRNACKLRGVCLEGEHRIDQRGVVMRVAIGRQVIVIMASIGLVFMIVTGF